MMRTSAAIVALIALTLPAHAVDYPVSGTWTYNYSADPGPAKTCGARTMAFDGNLRHDTGSGAPEYKNVAVTKSDATAWRIVDEFFTGMIRGRVTYALHMIDNDHIELRIEMGGATTKLRRCS